MSKSFWLRAFFQPLERCVLLGAARVDNRDAVREPPDQLRERAGRLGVAAERIVG
jgi:hypothetical protein